MTLQKADNIYIINISKSFTANANTILNSFKDGTVFKLTDADEIQFDFRAGEKFQLIFKDRGKIYGRFTKISDDELILDWNVEGFNRPPEMNTNLKISLQQVGDNCYLTLEHSNIVHKDAADAKQNAWAEILDEIENILN